jgi:hypothetical protein
MKRQLWLLRAQVYLMVGVDGNDGYNAGTSRVHSYQLIVTYTDFW